MPINADWHQAHPMPKRATLAQRAAWHAEHAKVCGCRPVPKSVQSAVAELTSGKGPTPKRRTTAGKR
jgi:hypothetical protein